MLVQWVALIYLVVLRLNPTYKHCLQLVCSCFQFYLYSTFLQHYRRSTGGGGWWWQERAGAASDGRMNGGIAGWVGRRDVMGTRAGRPVPWNGPASWLMYPALFPMLLSMDSTLSEKRLAICTFACRWDCTLKSLWIVPLAVGICTV